MHAAGRSMILSSRKKALGRATSSCFIHGEPDACLWFQRGAELRHPNRSPDNAKIKQKMVFASSRDALRRALVGIAAEVQGTDYSEVAHEAGKSCLVESMIR